jgi:hypothetical protein
MNRTLIPEPPLQVLPSLAVAIGLNQAIVLQQIHYWLINPSTKNNIYDGERWVYNPLESKSQHHDRDSWANQFPFWSVDTIKRTISKLVNQGLLIKKQLRLQSMDRTMFYRIDYAMLAEYTSRPVQNAPIDESSLTPSYTETTAETTSEKTPNVPTADALCETPSAEDKQPKPVETKSPEQPTLTLDTPEPDKPKPISADDYPDFDKARCLYRTLHPRVPGVTKAFDKFRRQHKKTWKTDIADLLPAIKAYAVECKQHGREQRHVKHWSTFVGPDRHWEEYMGSPETPANGLRGISPALTTRPDPLKTVWLPISGLVDEFKAQHDEKWRKAPCGAIYHVKDDSKPASVGKGRRLVEEAATPEQTDAHIGELFARFGTKGGETR